MATSLDLSRTYTSYSGVDIRIVINGEYVGSMQALSYAIQREKAPIYVMGRVDPRSFSRGKRGIAGTMISLLLDRHLLYSGSFTGEQAVLDTDEIFVFGAPGRAGSPTGSRPTGGRAQVEGEGEPQRFGFDIYDGSANGTLVRNVAGTAPFGEVFDESDLGNNYEIHDVFYVDQILPFDVSIIAVNEYGNAAQMRMYGCEILNEGSGFSIDDMVVENQMTYICRTILPWLSFSGSTDMNSKDTAWIRQLYNSVRGNGNTPEASNN